MTDTSGNSHARGAATGAVETQNMSPELAKIVAAWPTLPDALRRAMLALIDSAGS
jgi:hypothetical protein